MYNQPYGQQYQPMPPQQYPPPPLQFHQQPPQQQNIQMGQPYGPPPGQIGAGIPVQMPIVLVEDNTDLMCHANGQRFPVNIKCPNCKKNCITTTSHELGIYGWGWAWILFGFTGICCCWIPFCYDDCKDVSHKCPNCQTEVGYNDKKCCCCVHALHGSY